MRLRLPAILFFLLAANAPGGAKRPEYPLHRDVTATVFWVGESGNAASAWDDLWEKHFGGVDDPERRRKYRPAPDLLEINGNPPSLRQ